jgi:ATP synthase protein I
VLGVFGAVAPAVVLVARGLPSAALLVALLTYTLQVLAMALAFVALQRSGELGESLSREWLAGSVIAGTASWLAVHVATALRARIPAYDLAGPEQVRTPSEAVAP